MVILWVLKSESRTDYYYHRAWNVISNTAHTRMFTIYLLNCAGVCSLAVDCVCEPAAVLFWELVEGHYGQNRKTGSELWCLECFRRWSRVMRFFLLRAVRHFTEMCAWVVLERLLLFSYFSVFLCSLFL